MNVSFLTKTPHQQQRSGFGTRSMLVSSQKHHTNSKGVVVAQGECEFPHKNTTPTAKEWLWHNVNVSFLTKTPHQQQRSGCGTRSMLVSSQKHHTNSKGVVVAQGECEFPHKNTTPTAKEWLWHKVNVSFLTKTPPTAKEWLWHKVNVSFLTKTPHQQQRSGCGTRSMLVSSQKHHTNSKGVVVAQGECEFPHKNTTPTAKEWLWHRVNVSFLTKTPHQQQRSGCDTM